MAEHMIHVGPHLCTLKLSQKSVTQVSSIIFWQVSSTPFILTFTHTYMTLFAIFLLRLVRWAYYFPQPQVALSCLCSSLLRAPNIIWIMSAKRIFHVPGGFTQVPNMTNTMETTLRLFWHTTFGNKRHLSDLVFCSMSPWVRIWSVTWSTPEAKISPISTIAFAGIFSRAWNQSLLIINTGEEPNIYLWNIFSENSMKGSLL